MTAVVALAAVSLFVSLRLVDEIDALIVIRRRPRADRWPR